MTKNNWSYLTLKPVTPLSGDQDRATATVHTGGPQGQPLQKRILGRVLEPAGMGSLRLENTDLGRRSHSEGTGSNPAGQIPNWPSGGRTERPGCTEDIRTFSTQQKVFPDSWQKSDKKWRFCRRQKNDWLWDELEHRRVQSDTYELRRAAPTCILFSFLIRSLTT